jgi:hypothetical protein
MAASFAGSLQDPHWRDMEAILIKIVLLTGSMLQKEVGFSKGKKLS